MIGVPDILSEGPSLDDNPASKDIDPLYFPIGLDGSLYPMPERAEGIFPLRGRRDQLASALAANDSEPEYFNELWPWLSGQPRLFVFDPSGRTAQRLRRSDGS